MAKALKLRQVAKNYQKQADAFSRLAKLQNQAALDMPQSNTATAVELTAAQAQYDLALRSYFTADSMQVQADAYTALADAAFAAGDTAEAP
jgi:hypothetical protein